jgi:hypothetical protein
MSEVQVLIDRCRKQGQATLRGVWPGRGALPTKIRANAKKLFGDQQIVKEEVDGENKVVATINYDKQRGVYQLS